MTETKEWSNEEYLDKKIRCLIEPLITSLLVEKPKEPILFMIEWLQNYSGVKNTNSVNAERAELQFLRKEMVKHNKTYKDETHAATDDDESENSEENDKFEEELRMKKANNAQKQQRVSVSAEAYGIFNTKKEYVPRIIAKSHDQKERIVKTLEKSFLFSVLSPKDKETVIMAFEEKKYLKEQIVIQQGDQGDILFLIESGYYECFKQYVRFL